MRWCRNCRSFNTGWPVRCRYCAAGLAGRLCPRNHINPPNPELAFCEDCGQPLHQAYGGSFSLRPCGVAGVVFLVTVTMTLALVAAAQHLGVGVLLLGVATVVVGSRLAYQLLPPTAQIWVAHIYRVSAWVGRGLFRLTLRLANGLRRTAFKGRGGKGRRRR